MSPVAPDLIDLRDVDHRPIRVASSPMPSLLAMAGEALGTMTRGAPRAWRLAARAALDTRDRAVLETVFATPNVLVPDCISPWYETQSNGFHGDGPEAIASTPGDVLLEQIVAEQGPDLPRSWRPVEQAPERWLQAYARAMARLSNALKPVWKAAAPLAEHEFDRIGSSAARGTVRELLVGLHPLARLRGDWLVLERPGSRPAYWRIPESGLTLVPMLGGSDALATRHCGDAVTHIGYPMPGRQRLLDAALPPSSDLEALLGRPRATILQRLDHPSSVGRLATALHAVPSAATHHVTALEAAGLVARERQGQRVVVRRTARGTAVLALYDAA